MFSSDLRRKLKLVSAGVALLTILSACGSAADVGLGEMVTTTQMDKALERVEVHEDEYSGNWEINPKNDVVVHVGDFWFVDTDALVSKRDGSDWEFAVASSYRLTDWLFQASVGFKSSKGSMSLDLGESIHDVDELASVSEIAFVSLDAEQITQFCEIMNGRSVKFRIVGTKGSIERKLPGATMYSNRAMCTIYRGLKQGIELVPK